MKKFISGLIVGGMLVFSSQVFAVAEDIKASFAEFVIKVNGNTKELQARPIVINGSTYLPLRELAGIVGYDVTYKADLRTIELNNVSVENTNQSSGTIPSNSDGGVIVEPTGTGTMIDGERVMVIGTDKFDGSFDDIILDGVRYKTAIQITELLNGKYKFDYNSASQKLSLINDLSEAKEVVLLDIPFINRNARIYVTHQFYLDHIFPLM